MSFNMREWEEERWREKVRRGVGRMYPPESPCVDLCELINNYCRGCGRTKEEIEYWPAMSESEKNIVLNRIGEKR